MEQPSSSNNLGRDRHSHRVSCCCRCGCRILRLRLQATPGRGTDLPGRPFLTHANAKPFPYYFATRRLADGTSIGLGGGIRRCDGLVSWWMDWRPAEGMVHVVQHDRKPRHPFILLIIQHSQNRGIAALQVKVGELDPIKRCRYPYDRHRASRGRRAVAACERSSGRPVTAPAILLLFHGLLDALCRLTACSSRAV